MQAHGVVLLVEDDPNVMTVTSLLLEDAGYQVLCASSANEAIAIANARGDIDLVFTDVNLRQGMNGIDMAKTLRHRSMQAAIVVASGDLSWADTPLEPGMTFVAKPYDRRTLLEAVRSGIGPPHALS